MGDVDFAYGQDGPQEMRILDIFLCVLHEQ